MPWFNLSVGMCVRVCDIEFVVLLIATAVRGRSPQKPGIYGIGTVWANAWDAFHRMPSRVARGRRAAVDFVVCFGWGGVLFRVFP